MTFNNFNIICHVLIVAKCNVNVNSKVKFFKANIVLIVAKCNVNEAKILLEVKTNKGINSSKV